MKEKNIKNRFFETVTPEIMQEIDRIIDASCSVWRVSPSDIKSKARLKPIPDATATASVLIEKYFDINETALAQILNRDRTSIYIYRRKFEDRRFNPEFAENLMKAQLIVETDNVDVYKHNISLKKRLESLTLLIEEMNIKKELISNQLKELKNVRLG